MTGTTLSLNVYLTTTYMALRQHEVHHPIGVRHCPSCPNEFNATRAFLNAGSAPDWAHNHIEEMRKGHPLALKELLNLMELPRHTRSEVIEKVIEEAKDAYVTVVQARISQCWTKMNLEIQPEEASRIIGATEIGVDCAVQSVQWAAALMDRLMEREYAQSMVPYLPEGLDAPVLFEKAFNVVDAIITGVLGMRESKRAGKGKMVSVMETCKLNPPTINTIIEFMVTVEQALEALQIFRSKYRLLIGSVS